MPDKYFQNNISGTTSLLSVMRSFEVKKLIYSSSATVYGIPEYLPIDEQHPLATINPYAETKLKTEQALGAIAAEGDEWDIVCLRYFNPVGAHKSGLIGEDPKGTPNNIMPYIVNVASGESPHINIYGDDYDTSDGTGVRDYVHVMDLAEAHLRALNYIGLEAIANLNLTPSLPLKQNFHIFNIGTGKGCSVLELIDLFQKANGITISHKFTARRPGDVASCYANVDKSTKAFQWIAKRSIQEMCSSAWNFKISEK